MEEKLNSYPELLWTEEDELLFQMGDMHGEVPVLPTAATAKALKKNSPLKPKALTKWTPDDELNFQMGDMHGEV